jgi:two-component system, NarL family, nitrate/nitrite response regulator NarL
VRAVTERQFKKEHYSTKQAHECHLTHRERQVAKLVCAGLSNKEIAKALSLTEGSVKQYVHRLFQKLGVNRRIRLREVGDSLFVDQEGHAAGPRRVGLRSA